MGDITVTPWGTNAATPQDATAPYHDCLWQIAQEQAVLERMQRTGEGWEAASRNVTDRDIRTQLDVVCDENGFRRLDGSGQGRDPNLIYTGNTIRVRIDPRQLSEPAPGVDNPTTGPAYTAAVTGPNGEVDMTRKRELDAWIATIPGFANLSEPVRTAMIEGYANGGDRQKLANLANSGHFSDRGLTDRQRVQLISVYGSSEQSVATQEIDRLLGEGVSCPTVARLALIGTEGFARLNGDQQRRLLERYGNDAHFRGAIDYIVRQNNFLDKADVAQAHALDVLYRYSGRNGDGYGGQNEEHRTRILVTFYNDVLASSDYGLNGVQNTRENDSQSEQIGDFADNVGDLIDDEELDALDS